jgi:hypothetical protein
VNRNDEIAISVQRSRSIRELILLMLWRADNGGSLSGGYSWAHLRDGFTSSRAAVAENELLTELRDLVDTGLVDRKPDETLGDDYYTIAPRGRDFKRAGYPWHRLDEFSGSRP